MIQKRKVGPSHYVVKMEKGEFSFLPGQYLHLGPKDSVDKREYSLYSGTDDDFLEILLSHQPGGELSPQICSAEAGDIMNIEGPYGSFTLSEEERTRPVYMIATGTGVSPFRSIVRSSPDLDYQLYHGVRTPAETLECESFESGRYLDCTSRSDEGKFQGRVTECLKTLSYPANSIFMFCGNSDMIYESISILTSRGVLRDNMRAEIYF